MGVKRTCWFFQGNNGKGMVFNTYKKIVVDCYVDADFVGLWGHANTYELNCTKSRAVFVASFMDYSIFWLSKIQTDIYLSNINYAFLEFSHSVIDLPTLKHIIKEVIENFEIDSKKMEFVSSSNF